MASADDNVSGWLEKRSEKLHQWRRRFFVLEGTDAKFYTKEGGKMRGVIHIVQTTTLEDLLGKPNLATGDRFEFIVHDAGGRASVRLCTRSLESKLAWLSAFSEAINLAKKLGVTVDATAHHSGSGSDGTEAGPPDTAAHGGGGGNILSKIKSAGSSLVGAVTGSNASASAAAPASASGSSATARDVSALQTELTALRARLAAAEASLRTEQAERSVLEEAMTRIDKETKLAADCYETYIAQLEEALRERDYLIESIRAKMGLQHWVDDSERDACAKCRAAFSLTKRRHHCRRCGEIFCGECSGQRVPVIAGVRGERIRVCEDCMLISDFLA